MYGFIIKVIFYIFLNFFFYKKSCKRLFLEYWFYSRYSYVREEKRTVLLFSFFAIQYMYCITELWLYSKKSDYKVSTVFIGSNHLLYSFQYERCNRVIRELDSYAEIELIRTRSVRLQVKYIWLMALERKI